MEKKIIFLDIDGTLIDYELNLPDSAKKAIEMAQENGHLIYSCTGCSVAEVEKRNYGIHFDGFIGGNGCYIQKGNEVILHKTLTLQQCTHFVNWCKSRDLAFRLECDEGMYICDDYEEKSRDARLQYARGKGADLPDGYIVPMNACMISNGNLYRDNVNKTAFVLKSYQDYLDAKEEFDDMVVGTWGGVGEEALYGDTSPLGVSKQYAVEYLLDYLKVNKKDAIGFGDAKSDIPMFNACGYSIAMGNGGKECKEVANEVTDDVNNDGLYKAFEKLGLI